MYRHKPHYLLLIILTIMAVMVYFCEPLMACKSSDPGAQSSGKSEQSQNAASSVSQHDVTANGVAQTDNGRQEGNGGDPATPLIDCSDHFWSEFFPCRRGE